MSKIKEAQENAFTSERQTFKNEIQELEMKLSIATRQVELDRQTKAEIGTDEQDAEVSTGH